MADNQQSTAKSGQHRFQPLDGRQVKMVGRFVQQQNFGLYRQGAGQGRPTPFASRQLRSFLVWIQR